MHAGSSPVAFLYQKWYIAAGFLNKFQVIFFTFLLPQALPVQGHVISTRIIKKHLEKLDQMTPNEPQKSSFICTFILRVEGF